MNTSIKHIQVMACCITTLLFVSQSWADYIFDFNSPAYVPGDLNGQNGWSTVSLATGAVDGTGTRRIISGDEYDYLDDAKRYVLLQRRSEQDQVFGVHNTFTDTGLSHTFDVSVKMGYGQLLSNNDFAVLNIGGSTGIVGSNSGYYSGAFFGFWHVNGGVNFAVRNEDEFQTNGVKAVVGETYRFDLNIRPEEGRWDVSIYDSVDGLVDSYTDLILRQNSLVVNSAGGYNTVIARPTLRSVDDFYFIESIQIIPESSTFACVIGTLALLGIVLRVRTKN